MNLKAKQSPVFKTIKKMPQITQTAGRATKRCQISFIIIFNYFYALLQPFAILYKFYKNIIPLSYKNYF